MPWETIARCAVCTNRIKGEGNKWLMFRLVPRSETNNVPRFELFQWDDGVSREKDIDFLCGESCLQKKLAEFTVRG
jgi:hypothetical protein